MTEMNVKLMSRSPDSPRLSLVACRSLLFACLLQLVVVVVVLLYLQLYLKLNTHSLLKSYNKYYKPWRLSALPQNILYEFAALINKFNMLLLLLLAPVFLSFFFFSLFAFSLITDFHILCALSLHSQQIVVNFVVAV